MDHGSATVDTESVEYQIEVSEDTELDPLGCLSEEKNVFPAHIAIFKGKCKNNDLCEMLRLKYYEIVESAGETPLYKCQHCEQEFQHESYIDYQPQILSGDGHTLQV